MRVTSGLYANDMSFFAKPAYLAGMETISPIYARLLLRELLRREIDPAPLFAGTAVSLKTLLRGGDIGMEDFLHILRTGDQLLGDEPTGFMLGRKMHVFAMGPVGAGMALAPSLRGGLQLLESFTRLHASYIDISARSTIHGITVTLLYEQETGYVERFHTETAVLLLQQYMETLSGEPICDADYRFAFPEPVNSQDYSNALHGRIIFDAGVNEVDIPHRWLDSPSPYYHPDLWRQAQMALSQRLKDRTETEETPYKQHLAGLFRTSTPPLPDLGDVAFDLNVSQRTLNRRLQAENTSFRELKSQALAHWAKQYLRETEDSVEAIADALGYRDAANFRRAFRKIEGCSPIEYRQRKAAEIS